MNFRNPKCYLSFLIFYCLYSSGQANLSKDELLKKNYRNSTGKVIVDNKKSTAKHAKSTTLPKKTSTKQIFAENSTKTISTRSTQPIALTSNTNHVLSNASLVTRRFKLNKVHKMVKVIEDSITKLSEKNSTDLSFYCKNCKGEYCRKRCKKLKNLLES